MASNEATRILVLGATGMLGSTVFRKFSADKAFQTFGTLRSGNGAQWFPAENQTNLIPDIYLEKRSSLDTAFSYARPDIVINCVGIIKQLPAAHDNISSIEINSLLPHRIASKCSEIGARLIHFGTDCVFSGKRGNYLEEDEPDAYDLYGRTKYLGEVDYAHAITLRTSIIGHELNSTNSLIDWFLAQTGTVKGYERAIFSGLPTVEIVRAIKEFVIPNPDLCGVYHLSADPISKHALLTLVAQLYAKQIEIIPDCETVIDRSLNSVRFREAFNYTPKPWPELIQEMRDDYRSLGAR
jgi:dTDP-4-dehydrorhamnose reductase